MDGESQGLACRHRPTRCLLLSNSKVRSFLIFAIIPVFLPALPKQYVQSS